MAGLSHDVGQGTTISFPTSGFDAEILTIGGPSFARDPIDVTHLGTADPDADEGNNMEFIASRLIDGGEVSLGVHVHTGQADKTQWPPINQPSETVRITLPLADGDSTAAYWEFPGFCTGYTPSIEGAAVITADMTVKVAGPCQFVPAA